ncbi:helix-turn-helix domain-containing protein [Candidatus Pristimantibacillus sp. PTI5]|uniref:helix-turn-helix domain-containing protein n=1 Tax=Candidatus Pristimantibacillus sp. PTI5 TaxID=3400422 RepID=UPI003B02202C
MDANKHLQNAIHYIEENLSDLLEPEQIADSAYMSVPNLYRLFYALTGHSLMDYIRKRRVNQAAVYLRHSERPILDIALDCGFDSYRTFATVFKRITGLTPGMYRKADFYYSFEPVYLLEKHSYPEDRELSLLYSDIKVIKTETVQVLAYRHRAPVSEGLEEEAFRLFFNLLESAGCATEKLRFFGYNLEPESGSLPYAYQIYTSFTAVTELEHPDVFLTEEEGGLYAVSKVPAANPSVIQAGWNRMLEEWLPRSSFKLGEHHFVEEHQHHRGKVTRLKLLLPVMRKQEQEPIVIQSLPPMEWLAFRSSGRDAKETADEELTFWLAGRHLQEEHRQALFMSYSYGISEEAHIWYELAIALPGDSGLAGTAEVRLRPGGLYASMTTSAYGVMTGVLDKLDAWVAQSGGYRLDESREWFGQYVKTEGWESERSTVITCYLPVIRKSMGMQ